MKLQLLPALLGVAGASRPAPSADADRLANTPPMGFNTYASFRRCCATHPSSKLDSRRRLLQVEPVPLRGHRGHPDGDRHRHGRDRPQGLRLPLRQQVRVLPCCQPLVQDRTAH